MRLSVAGRDTVRRRLCSSSVARRDPTGPFHRARTPDERWTVTAGPVASAYAVRN